MGAVLVVNRAQLRRGLKERNPVVVSMAKWEIQTVTCLVPSEWDITRYPMATRTGAMQGRLEMRVRYDAYRPQHHPYPAYDGVPPRRDVVQRSRLLSTPGQSCGSASLESSTGFSSSSSAGVVYSRARPDCACERAPWDVGLGVRVVDYGGWRVVRLGEYRCGDIK